MHQPRKKRFAFASTEEMKPGSRGDDVIALQHLLVELGYLQGGYSSGRYCRRTRSAVRRFQRFYGVRPAGVVGADTRRLLETPRCGVPDLPSGRHRFAPFSLRGCKYEKSQLTYAFLNGTGDLEGCREREIVREAFDAWAGVADLEFSEVGPDEDPDFRIAWRAGEHGDGSSFDGPGNTLAHAFFPPPCGGPHAGDLHFDEGERWSDDSADDGIHLRPVAIHEIGHLLGLSHSRDPGAIMFAIYSPDRVALAADDIRGIRALYGPPGDGTRTHSSPMLEPA